MIVNDSEKDYEGDSQHQASFLAEKDAETSLIRRYKVIIYNDNFTPMDFVVEILQKYFQKKMVEAENLMIAVHKNGFAVAGIYPKEIAEAKILQVKKEALQHHYPLRLSVEKIK